ncbi:MAG: DUF4834 family protein [Cytophagales bacterium]|nr:MAG: DUF4834 family protein [Cytophagales bacterium]
MKYILFIVVFVFLFGKIIKYALKYWFSSKLKEAQKEFDQNRNFQNASSQQKEGTIRVDKTSDKSNKNQSSSAAGDYIDYEIVK